MKTCRWCKTRLNTANPKKSLHGNYTEKGSCAWFYAKKKALEYRTLKAEELKLKRDAKKLDHDVEAIKGSGYY